MRTMEKCAFQVLKIKHTKFQELRVAFLAGFGKGSGCI